MTINQQQIDPNSGVAQMGMTFTPNLAASQTGEPFLLRQIRHGFIGLMASIYARTYTATLAVDYGFVPVGTTLKAVTLTIATTTDRFKINAIIVGLSGTKSANTGLATVVNKGVTDNLEFSEAYTINTAAATGQFWGAFRIQMDSAGAVSTRAYATNQTFTTEADALRNCPAAAANYVNLGTISIRSGSGIAFVCNTTALTGGGVTVNYNGAASGFTSFLTGTIAPVAANLIQGTMKTEPTDRTVQHPGAFLVGNFTTDGTFAATELETSVTIRPYPLNQEATFQE